MTQLLQHSGVDSDALLSLKQLPKSLTIVGAGVIGCEYACILATLGIPVVLVERDRMGGE